MLPWASIAGLATGWRFSAIGTATRTSCGLLLKPLVETTTSPEAAPSGTRATMNCSELIMTGPSTSPKLTRGRRSSCGPSPLPTMRISPPGNAHMGSRASMCGLPFTFRVPVLRSTIIVSGQCSAARVHEAAGLRYRSEHFIRWRQSIPSGQLTTSLVNHPEVQHQLQNNQSIDTRAEVVDHDANPFRQFFQAPHGRQLHDIEYAKKYKAGEKRLPHNGTRNQGHQLPRHLIDDHMRRVFLSAPALFQRRRRNANRHHDCDQHQNDREAGCRRKMRRQQPPQQCGRE